MPSLKEYFDNNRYKAKYEFMERVTGVYNGMRWIGSVGNDTLVSEERGPELHIILDLPLKIDGVYRTTLIIPHKGVTKLKVFDKEI